MYQYHMYETAFLLVIRIISILLIVIGAIRFYIKKNHINKAIIEDEEKEKKLNKNKVVFALIIVAGILVFAFCTLMNVVNDMAYKPIIYLYPTKDEEISVKLKYKDKLTVSYPTYTEGWKVFAKTNGDLMDLETNKNLYSLYYESENTYHFKVEEDGFIVKSDNVLEFLEDKLSILGLNYKEKQEFIIYWLPILQKNKYTYIRFATIEEINENMPLEIEPNPDTIIRILMTYKCLNKPLDIKEQKLMSPERKGFVVVEWGGTEIK